jgi:hypothetical protein
MKKTIFLLTVFSFGVSLFPIDAQALTTKIDQRCFEKQKCIQIRREVGLDFGNQKPEDGFIQNAETLAACGAKAQGSSGQEMGFCLPVGQTETMVSFGGRRKFSDIGDFIRYMYKYAIMVAGLLSTLMIIVAGFQWAVSGGNSSTIQSAQKKIGNSIIGLMVAVLSYTILNWVNPNLVNFRLPQIWLINTIEIQTSPYCSDQPDGTMLAFAKNQEDTSVKSDDLKKRAEGPYDRDRFSGACGSNYFILNGGGQTCQGDSGPAQAGGASSSAGGSNQNCRSVHVEATEAELKCNPASTPGEEPDCGMVPGKPAHTEEVCDGVPSAGAGGQCDLQSSICGPRNDKSGIDGCFSGDILVRVYNKANGLFRSTENWEGFPWMDAGEHELWGVCADGKNFEIPGRKDDGNKNETDHLYQFSFSITGGPLSVKQTVIDNCKGTDPTFFKGFALSVEMKESGDFTDEEHYIGTDQKGNALDLGDQEAFNHLTPIMRPDFLIPLKAFVLTTENGGERIGSKVRLKLNINDIADLDNGSDYGGQRTAEQEREYLYAQYSINGSAGN